MGAVDDEGTRKEWLAAVERVFGVMGTWGWGGGEGLTTI
jgi:hypothetical protein